MEGRTAFNATLARELIERRSRTPGAALPILHDLQHAFGYVDDEALALMAEALNISKAEALGVVSFYPDFRRKQTDGRIVKLCRAESCRSMGCEELVDRLERQHGLTVDKAEPGDRIVIDTVYCLGQCAVSPAALVDGEPVGRLDAEKIDAIVAGASVRPQ